MAINFPISLDDNTSLPIVVDAVTDVLAVHQNDPRLAIIALEGKVGITASTPVVGTYLKGTGTGTSEWSSIAIDDLSDVIITSALVDQTLRFNGSEWVNSEMVAVSASSGIEFFPDTTDIIAKSAENDFVLETLNKFPVTTGETVDAISCANNTVIASAYLYDAALGRTSIDAGNWGFDFYLSVSSVAAGRVSSVTKNIYKVSPYTNPTVSITGSGTSRTCTASSGTPFATTKIDASATNTTASFVRTPKGVYQITARTSDTEVTIATPTGYGNESTVAFSVWKKLFGAGSATITNLTTNYGLYSTNTSQPAFTIAVTDKLGMVIFGTSNNTTTVNYVYNGNVHYSHFATPLITLHDNLAGLQGGAAGEYYHLTAAQATVATQAATASVNGYATSVQITKLDGIAAGATANAKASSAELDTGTDDAKFATPLAIAGSSATLGWIPIRDTWAYASASTITIAAGGAAKYQKGDKIKLTQHSVTKVGYIVAIADTTLTIIGFTVEDTATYPITAAFYSHCNAVGFPDWIAFTPSTWGGIDDGSGGSPTVTVARFKIDGCMCTVHLRFNGTKVTTNSIFTIANTNLPTIAFTTALTALGSCYTYTNSTDYLGVVVYNSNFTFQWSTNLTDNWVVGAAGATFSYEF